VKYQDISDRLDTISFYNNIKNKENSIDDMTWNDLNMNEIYCRISSNTISNIGEEYLYYMLHALDYESKSLEHKNRLIEFFDKNEEVRVEVQYLYSKFQKLYGYSAYQCIEESKSIIKRPMWPHVLMGSTFLVSLIIMFFSLKIGVILLAFVSLHNIFQYYKAKRYIEDSYFISFRYMAKMLRLSKKVCNIKANELKEYQEDFKIIWNKFKSISRLSIFLHIGVGFVSDLYDFILDYIRILTHVDIVVLYYLSDKIKDNMEWVNRFCEIIGLLDAAIAIAEYRRQLPFYCIPILSNDKEKSMKVVDLYHPLLDNPITNSINIANGILITGSNASGKSTFIKSIAINAILSQTINTSITKEYQGNFYKIYTSMDLKDNIKTNESYYIVEIKAIKRILNQIEEKIPTLCCIDEVLRGTNTIERIAASSQILKHIGSKNAICITATHDIELTYLLEKEYDNYHFTEEIREDGILFPYTLIDGRAKTRNAIKLLEIMEYPINILENAKIVADNFEKRGKWINNR
jgi:DNA mismatch repair ATPase MutS